MELGDWVFRAALAYACIVVAFRCFFRSVKRESGTVIACIDSTASAAWMWFAIAVMSQGAK